MTMRYWQHTGRISALGSPNHVHIYYTKEAAMTEETNTEPITKLPRPAGGPGLDSVREQAAYDEQQRVVDAVFSAAIVNGWCGDVLTALSVVYPSGSPWSDGEWRNSEGRNVYGYDVEGYSADGYNANGFNREGRNRQGRTADEQRAYNTAQNTGCTCSLCRDF